MATPATLDTIDFSPVLGGPLYQLFRRAHLSGDALQMLHRRIVVITCVAWIPLLVLAWVSGNALGDHLAIPFLHDVENHTRFLVALPILIAAELTVHRRIVAAVRNFVERGIVTAEERPRFQAAIDATLRLRNSAVIEICLLVFVYTGGLWVWRNQIALETASWYAIPDGQQMRFTLAGYWFIFVSVPIFQFILLRWYFRFFVWFWFLFRVSRLNLSLMPMHPDRTGGLGFLSTSTYAYAPVLLAQGTVLAGLVASQIFFAGRNLMDFKVQILAYLGVLIVPLLIPLTVFLPRLAEAKRQGLRDGGRLATRYVRQFTAKWIPGDVATDRELLGSGDLQSLADLGTSCSVVSEMRLVPFGLTDVARLVIVAAVPFLPLTLTTFSLEELADQLIKVIF